jgi:hypothetical protein
MSMTTCVTLVQALGEKLVQASRLAPPPVVTSAWRALEPSVACVAVYERVQLATAAQEPFSVDVSKLSMSSVQGVAAETVAVEVTVDVTVSVEVGVGVAVLVAVLVMVRVDVTVKVLVKVSVGPPTVSVMVGVAVTVAVEVEVKLAVTVDVEVTVRVAVKVEVILGVWVKVVVQDSAGTAVFVLVGGKVGLATWRLQPQKKTPINIGNAQRIHIVLKGLIAWLLGDPLIEVGNGIKEDAAFHRIAPPTPPKGSLVV